MTDPSTDSMLPDVYAVHHAAPADAAAATAALGNVHGVLEVQAALLALLLPPGSKRAGRAFEIETMMTTNAAALRRHVDHLPGAARLPWFERLLSRMALHPLSARKTLLQAVRRLMGARGVARPIDRLHWLVMRRGLGEVTAPTARAEISDEVAEWLESDVLAMAAYSAFLSRMVPGAEPDSPGAKAWYDEVMTSWQPFGNVPEWLPPSTDDMVRALGCLQTLSLMQRPVVIRNWVTTAAKLSRGIELTDLSADALRMTCVLLETPQPPELNRHHVDLDATEPYLP